MDSTLTMPPVVLIAVSKEQWLASALGGDRFAVIQVHTGALALEVARDVRPDVIILEATLPDMSGIEASRGLHADLHIGHYVPILLVTRDKPTPEQRVTALRAGVWDFLRYPRDPDELTLTLQAYVQAKRNIDIALADDMVDPLTAVHGRAVLARRARELGALMARRHGGLACVVFAVTTEAMDPQVLNAVVRAARVSDVVGSLGPTEFAVLAPATDHAGAVRLAHRVADALREVTVGPRPLVPGTTLRAGYDAVDNLRYSPSDPVDLLMRANAAVKSGTPEPGSSWVSRFEGVPATTTGPLQPRATPPGIVVDTRGTSP
ncbi:MAG TPA: response regulator [Gemmatimonadales bacterium]|nr:response regulator [Gemmatimonadales bacterium]